MKSSKVRLNAFKLRLKGYSYNEVTAELGIPQSTLGTWFRGVVLSNAAQARLAGRVRKGVINSFIKRNKLQTHLAEQRARLARKDGKDAVKNISKRELLFAGASLYWAEGYKRLKVRDGKERMSHAISFVNADPEMICTFIRFALVILEIPSSNFRFSMRLYPHINEKEAKRFWMQVTGFPKERFFKTTWLVSGASKGIRPFNRLPWGTIQVEICNTLKFHYLLGLIDGVKKELGSAILAKMPR